MRYAVKTLFLLSTGLWLGGMLMTLTVLMVFFARDRNLAVQVGPTLILTFEYFQMLFGILAISSLIAWRLFAVSKPKRIILPLVLVAIVGALISSTLITPQVNHLWYTGQGGTKEFWKWHGISQMIYMTQVLCLLATLGLTPWVMDSEK